MGELSTVHEAPAGSGQSRRIAPVLTIELFEPEPVSVSIFGAIYQIRPIELFSQAQQQRLRHYWLPASEVMDRIARDEEISEQDELVLEHGLEEIIKAAIPKLSDDNIKRLTPNQKQELVYAFFGALTTAEEPEEASPRQKAPRQRTGAKSRRTSNDSTVQLTHHAG